MKQTIRNHSLVSKLALICALLATVATLQAQELFQFSTHSDGADFNGAIDAPSVSGNFTFTTTSPTYLQENGSLIFMYRAGSTNGGTISSTLNVLSSPGDSVQTFTVNSFLWQAAASSTDTLTGYSGGVGGTQQWQVSGIFASPTSVSAATTGSFGNQIDTIVWTCANYTDNSFGHNMDNLSINIVVVPEPSTFALLGLGLASLVIFRRRR